MYETVPTVETDLVTPCLALVTSLLAVYLSTVAWRRRFEGMKDPASNLPLPPGGFGWPLVGETLNFLTKGFRFYDDKREEHGETFKTHMLGSPVVRTSSSEQIAKLVAKESSCMTASLPHSASFAFGKDGLVMASGEKHAVMKKSIKQAFTPVRLADYLPIIQSCIRKHVISWREGSSDRKLLGFHVCQELGAELLLKTVTGCGLDHDPERKVREAFVTCNDQLFCVPVALPGTGFYKAKLARKVIVDFLNNKLKSGKFESQNHVTILDILVAHQRGECGQLSDDQVIDNTVSLLVAGSDTVSSALCSILRLLGSNHDKLAAVRDELASEDLLENSLDGDLTYDLVQNLPYTRAVAKEVLRLLPPVGGTFRWTKKMIEMEDYQIPKDWQVVYGIRDMHKQTSAFADKESFLPERWMEKGFEEKLKRDHPFGYAPFGFSSRMCPAKDLALLEMCVFIAEVARLADWTPLNPGAENVYSPTTRPVDNLPMTFRNRE